MLKRIPKSDISIRPFKAYKDWDRLSASASVLLAEHGDYTKTEMVDIMVGHLSGSTYNVSSSFTNLFNPLYFVGTIASLSTVSTGMTQTSGVTSVSTAGGTIQTAGAVYDSTGTTNLN